MADMPNINVILDGDQAWPDLLGKKGDQVIHLTKGFSVAALPGGMESGKPSLMIRIDLPDGRVVLQETSLTLWAMAARVFKERYGDLGGMP